MFLCLIAFLWFFPNSNRAAHHMYGTVPYINYLTEEKRKQNRFNSIGGKTDLAIKLYTRYAGNPTWFV